jgi:hypothetical protein
LDLVERLALALDLRQAAGRKDEASRLSNNSVIEANDMSSLMQEKSLHLQGTAEQRSTSDVQLMSVARASAQAQSPGSSDDSSTIVEHKGPHAAPRGATEHVTEEAAGGIQPRRALVRAARAIAEYIHGRLVSSVHSGEVLSATLSEPPPDLGELVAAGLIPLLEVLLWSEGAVILNDIDGLTAAVYGATALADVALYAPFEAQVGSASLLECLRRVLTSHCCYRFTCSTSPLSQLLLRECWRCLRNIAGNAEVAARVDFLAREAEKAREPTFIELALLMSRTFEAPPVLVAEAWAAMRNWCAATVALASQQRSPVSEGGSRRGIPAHNPSACAMLLEQTRLGQDLWELAAKCWEETRACAIADDASVYCELLEQIWALNYLLLASMDGLQRDKLDLMALLEPVETVLRIPLQLDQEPIFFTDTSWDHDASKPVLVPHNVRIACLGCLRVLLESNIGLQHWLRYTRRQHGGGYLSDSIPLMGALKMHLTCTQISESPVYYALAYQAAQVIGILSEFGPARLDILHTPGLVQGLVGQVAAQSLDLLSMRLQPVQTAATVTPVPDADANELAEQRSMHWEGHVPAVHQSVVRLLSACLEALANLAVLPMGSSTILSVMGEYGGMRTVLDLGQQLESQPMIRSRLRRLLLSLRHQVAVASTKPERATLDLEEAIRELSHTAAFLGSLASPTRITLMLRDAQRTLGCTLLRKSVSSEFLNRPSDMPAIV